MWLKLKENANIREKLKKAIPSIGRIELPGNPSYPYGGTGFVVGEGLVMTNRHVAGIFASGVGTRTLSFKPGHRAGIDFLRELDRPTGPYASGDARRDGASVLGHGVAGRGRAHPGSRAPAAVPPRIRQPRDKPRLQRLAILRSIRGMTGMYRTIFSGRYLA